MKWWILPIENTMKNKFIFILSWVKFVVCENWFCLLFIALSSVDHPELHQVREEILEPPQPGAPQTPWRPANRTLPWDSEGCDPVCGDDGRQRERRSQRAGRECALGQPVPSAIFSTRFALHPHSPVTIAIVLFVCLFVNLFVCFFVWSFCLLLCCAHSGIFYFLILKLCHSGGCSFGWLWQRLVFTQPSQQVHLFEEIKYIFESFCSLDWAVSPKIGFLGGNHSVTQTSEGVNAECKQWICCRIILAQRAYIVPLFICFAFWVAWFLRRPWVLGQNGSIYPLFKYILWLFCGECLLFWPFWVSIHCFFSR